MNPNNKAKSQIILLDPAMLLFCTNSLIYFDKNVSPFNQQILDGASSKLQYCWSLASDNI